MRKQIPAEKAQYFLLKVDVHWTVPPARYSRYLALLHTQVSQVLFSTQLYRTLPYFTGLFYNMYSTPLYCTLSIWFLSIFKFILYCSSGYCVFYYNIWHLVPFSFLRSRRAREKNRRREKWKNIGNPTRRKNGRLKEWKNFVSPTQRRVIYIFHVLYRLFALISVISNMMIYVKIIENGSFK